MDVIILTTVRSNKAGTIGFLQVGPHLQWHARHKLLKKAAASAGLSAPVSCTLHLFRLLRCVCAGCTPAQCCHHTPPPCAVGCEPPGDTGAQRPGEA
jgi:hypothetical protein